MFRFPEKRQAPGTWNSHKATILFFPQQGRVSGMRPAMSQQHLADPGDITKWLVFKIRKVADNNWQVRARIGPRDKSHYVASFNSEGQTLEWIASTQADEWLERRATRRRQAGGDSRAC